MPGSSGAASIVRGGVRGRAVGTQRRSQLCFGCKRSLPAQESCVVFNDSITKGKSSMTAFFSPFVPSSLPEGSPSLAAGLCGQEAAEQTSLFLPSIEGALIKRGNPRPAARGSLKSRRQGWHPQPWSRALPGSPRLLPAGLGSARGSPSGLSHQP